MKKSEESLENSNLMDVYGRKLLEELARDARISYADLGRKIGLSATSAAERLKKMEDAGIIRGYSVDIDPEALGLELQAYVRMTCDGPRYQAFVKFVKTLAEVRQCHHVTGGDAFFLEIWVGSIRELERIIERLLPYGIPTTSIVLSSPVVRREWDLPSGR